MDNEKLKRANQLYEEIESLQKKIKRIDEFKKHNNQLFLKNEFSGGFAVSEENKQIIISLAKNLMETDLKKLQAEFDAL